MRRIQIAASTVLIALAIASAACGGTDTGGSGIASTPTPPATAASSPAPVPAPQPSPAAATIGAPASPQIANASLLPVATTGGPTILGHPTTTFPLLETVVSIDGSGTAGDAASTAGGATLATGGGTGAVLSVGNEAAGVNNVALVPGSSGILSGHTASKDVFLQLYDSGSALSWTSFGFWDVVSTNASRRQGAFVTGYSTPLAAIPTTGSGSFVGTARGVVLQPQAGRENGLNSLPLDGVAQIDVYFDSGTVLGQLSQMFATSFEGDRSPWNGVSFTGQIVAGQNLFTGSAQVFGGPAGGVTLGGSAKGALAGMFFGPNATEVGATWTLSDGLGAAFGTIAASRTGDAPNPWGY